jgi:hypothetical protein
MKQSRRKLLQKIILASIFAHIETKRRFDVFVVVVEKEFFISSSGGRKKGSDIWNSVPESAFAICSICQREIWPHLSAVKYELFQYTEKQEKTQALRYVHCD